MQLLGSLYIGNKSFQFVNIRNVDKILILCLGGKATATDRFDTNRF